MIECDKCKAQVNPKVKEEHIPETKLDIKYIQCEECKKKYIVLLEDVKTKTMVLRIKNIVKVEAYRKGMEKYQKIIQRYQLQLRNNNRELIKDYL